MSVQGRISCILSKSTHKGMTLACILSHISRREKTLSLSSHLYYIYYHPDSLMRQTKAGKLNNERSTY